MILFYHKMSTVPHGDGIVAKCSNCKSEYLARYGKCYHCGSDLKEWIIDIFDESHHKMFKKHKSWWRKFL